MLLLFKMINKKLSIISLFLIFSLLIAFAQTDSTVYSITGTISDDSNYNKADFSIAIDDDTYYFQYPFTITPASRIGAFRFEFDQFDTGSINNQVFCTFVDVYVILQKKSQMNKKQL